MNCAADGVEIILWSNTYVFILVKVYYLIFAVDALNV